MLRTIFTVGALTLLGLVVVTRLFGVVGGLFGFLLSFMIWMLQLAIQIAIIGFIVYLVIRIISPDTARRMRERWGGPTT